MKKTGKHSWKTQKETLKNTAIPVSSVMFRFDKNDCSHRYNIIYNPNKNTNKHFPLDLSKLILKFIWGKKAQQNSWESTGKKEWHGVGTHHVITNPGSEGSLVLAHGTSPNTGKRTVGIDAIPLGHQIVIRWQSSHCFVNSVGTGAWWY